MVDSGKQRAASYAACKTALLIAQVDASIALDSLEQIRNFGVLSNQRVSELNDLAGRLDERYFDLQDQDELNLDLQVKALYFFSQARAITAVAFAGGADALTAAMEAIYEALMAVADDGHEINNAVLEALGKDPIG